MKTQVKQARSYTTVLLRISPYYMAQYYDRISPCRIRRNTVIYGEKNDRLRFLYTESVYGLRFAPYFPVYHRNSPYTVTEIYGRNTEPCNTEIYGEVRSYTASYMAVNDRLRSP